METKYKKVVLFFMFSILVSSLLVNNILNSDLGFNDSSSPSNNLEHDGKNASIEKVGGPEEAEPWGNSDSGPDVTYPVPETPGYKLEPNVTRSYETRDSFFIVETNSHGWRDREFPVKPGEETLRIAVVGNHIAFGRRVNNSQTWVKQLEERINNSRENKKIELLNFGSIGKNARDKVNKIETWVLDYRPDLILLQLSSHDEFNTTRIEELEKKYLENITSPTEEQRGIAQVRAVHQEQIERRNKSDRERMEIVVNSVKDIDRLAETRDIPVVSIGINLRTGQEKILNQTAADLGWIFHSVPEKYAHGPENHTVSNNYLNPEGHRSVAEYLDRELSGQIIEKATE